MAVGCHIPDMNVGGIIQQMKFLLGDSSGLVDFTASFSSRLEYPFFFRL